MTTLAVQSGAADRWRVLALSVMTNALVTAAPLMALPVLFDEISADLGLSLVQVGLVWGIGAVPGIFAGLLGGVLGDRFGSRRVIALGCLLAGIFGALRGLSNSFLTLTVTMFLAGMVGPLMPLNTLKTCGQRFSRRQWGLASGALSMGMALGFLLGSLFSATVLSPLLGGWRNVMFFYSGLAVLFGVPWLFVKPAPGGDGSRGVDGKPIGIRESVLQVVRIRNILLFGLVLLGFGGSIQGALGYLPLYLRNLGWAPALADSALASFHTISLVFAIPIALFSDRLGSRKGVLIAASLLVIGGFGFLSFAQGALIWAAILAAGFVRDGFMAVYMAAVIETDGVGTALAGTATGLMMVFSSVGNLLAPPVGNSLAGISPGIPFVFWAGLTGVGLVSLLAVREQRNEIEIDGPKRVPVPVIENSFGELLMEEEVYAAQDTDEDITG